MNAKRGRKHRGTRAARPLRPSQADGTGQPGTGEPPGDRYGQLADWIGVSAVGGGGADGTETVAFVGLIAGVRAIPWWVWRLARLVRHRRPAEPREAGDRPSER